MPKEKVCTKCGITKLATAEYFYKCLDCKDGLRPDCKECRKIYDKKHLDRTNKVQRNRYSNDLEYREKMKQRAFKYRKNHPNSNKDYYKKNKKKQQEAVKRWRKDNPDKVKAHDKKWRESDKGKERRKLNRIYYRARNHFEALKIYDFKCQDCRCNDIIILEFHHINGAPLINGRREKADTMHNKIRKIGKKLDDVQLLCKNCHEYADIRDNRRGIQRLMILLQLIEEEENNSVS